MKRSILLLILIALGLSAFATPNNLWDVLTKLKFKVCFDEKIEDVIFEPIPIKEIKNLEGKTIELKGYLEEVNYPEENVTLILSKYENPFGSCYMHGAETLVKIIPKHKIIANPKKICTLKGRFEFNTTDLLELPFILYEVECLDCEK